MAISSKQKFGVVVIVLSLVLGMGGTVWSIFAAFDGLATAENAGIGSVGDSIRNALVFTVGGLVGTIIGALMLIFGRAKSSQSTR